MEGRGSRGPVAAAVEPVTLSLARRGGDWTRPAQGGEGSLGAQSSGIVARGQEEPRGPVWSDPKSLEQVRSGAPDLPADLSLELPGLRPKPEVSPAPRPLPVGPIAPRPGRLRRAGGAASS